MVTSIVSSIQSRVAMELEIAGSVVICSGLSLDGRYYHFVKDSAGSTLMGSPAVSSEGKAFPRPAP